MKDSNRYRVPVALLLFTITLVWLTCSTNKVDDPLGINNFSAAELTALTNSEGLEKDTFYTYETIFLSMDGLIPLEQTNIEVIKGCASCQESIKRAVVVTDRDGKITNLPIWYHVGVLPYGLQADMSGEYTVLVTQPPKHDPWTRYEMCFEIVNDISPDPQIHAVAQNGSFKGQASLVGNDVYAMGFHVNADSVKLWIVDDDEQYEIGDSFVDLSGGVEVVEPAGDGSIPPTLIWPGAAVTGSYNLVADVKPFGEFNDGDVISFTKMAGLVVQEAPGSADIITDIACDITGMPQNTFDDLAPIFAHVEPQVRPADVVSWMLPLPHFVPVFVTPHKDTWHQDDKLVTIRTSGTHQMPVYVQMNEYSGAIDLFRLRGENKSGYYLPLRLWPGDYDVVVDVNRNFMYDPGIDLLDGGPQVGFTVTSEEEMPEMRLINTASEDILGRASRDPFLFAHLVREDNSPIPGVMVKFKVVLGPGTVRPAVGITNAEGIAATRVLGLQVGEMTRVRTEAVVDDSLHYDVVSFFKTLPCTHDQGHGHGNFHGFVSGP